RLPVSGQPGPPPAPPVSDPGGAGRSEVFRLMRLDRLHALGVRGQGVRVAVLAGDFAGYPNYLGRGLPAGTRFVDLTAERNREIQPDPMGQGVGDGVRCALAVAAAARGAETPLARVAPAAPHQALSAARLFHGALPDSDPLVARALELRAEQDEILAERARLVERRRQAFSDYSIEE